ncbi:MAG: hypothetical protein MI824_00590 [Hyphomicrobiales bacterium]|nr:hypothetical protein [Hyphomicrobiales bacterium]
MCYHPGMCADPKLRGALLAELRQELAERRGRRRAARDWALPRVGLIAAVALVTVALL